MSRFRTWLVSAWLLALPVVAQTTGAVPKSDPTRAAAPAPTNQFDYLQAREAVRTNCIQGRRIVCGKVVKVLPGGWIVDSGYTNLMRPPLDRFWLIPGTVAAERGANLVEKNEPDCACVGLVYLTDPPKTRRRAKPKVSDYIVMQAFPAGSFSYNSVGTLQRTVRHFSGNLAKAVQIDLDAQLK